MGSMASSITLCVQMGGKFGFLEKIHFFNSITSSLLSIESPVGISPFKHNSYNRLPSSFCKFETISLNCLAIAWPLSDSTLKLLVLVGKIKNATTVVSEPLTFSLWLSLAKASMNISAPLFENSYRPAENK